MVDNKKKSSKFFMQRKFYELLYSSYVLFLAAPPAAAGRAHLVGAGCNAVLQCARTPSRSFWSSLFPCIHHGDGDNPRSHGHSALDSTHNTESHNKCQKGIFSTLRLSHHENKSLSLRPDWWLEIREVWKRKYDTNNYNSYQYNTGCCIYGETI